MYELVTQGFKAIKASGGGCRDRFLKAVKATKSLNMQMLTVSLKTIMKTSCDITWTFSSSFVQQAGLQGPIISTPVPKNLFF